MSKGSGVAAFGGIVGFSVALAILISKDKGLQKEATGQIRTALKTTGKLVRHYKNLGDRVAGRDEPSSEAPAWDRILENINSAQTTGR